MRLLLVALLPLVLGAFERLAAPDADLLDPVWAEHAPAGAGGAVDHRPWAAFLARYRREGADGVARLAYGEVSAADRAALAAYIARLAAVDPRGLSRETALAYWINLYNAATVDLVLAHYPVGSIREIGAGLFEDGPWEREAVRVLGRPLSLDDIEHGIIRPVFAEPRIHYAVNCAAIGCPDLAAEPYKGARIAAQLAAAEREFVNDPRGVRLEGGELVLSKIWLWFREDFAEDEAALLDGLRRVADGRAAAALAGRAEVDRYDYDWALADAR